MRFTPIFALGVILTLPSQSLAVERLSSLSRRYGECNHAKVSENPAPLVQSQTYILCLLRPIQAESQKNCDTTGECEKIGLFRAISIVNELIENDVTIQTPMRKAFGACDSERLEVFSRRVLRWVRLGGYQLSGPTAQTSWGELCANGKPLASVVDILMEAHLRKSISRDY